MYSGGLLKRSSISAAALALGTLVLVGSLNAAPLVTIVDDNSTASFDLGADVGMYAWTINNIEQITRQWFWYRIGATGGEAPIHMLGNEFHGTTDTDFDQDHETLFVRYEDQQLRAEMTFKLTGSEPGNVTSDVAESIRLTNRSSAPLDLHFFQLVDLDLGDTPTDKSVQIVGRNTAQQADMGTYASETVLTPTPSHMQVDFAPNLFNSLSDASPTVLNDQSGPIGPGDLSWAFQWDVPLGPSGSPTSTLLISKDKQIVVPEPATLALLGFGAAAVLGRKRNRS